MRGSLTILTLLFTAISVYAQDLSGNEQVYLEEENRYQLLLNDIKPSSTNLTLLLAYSDTLRSKGYLKTLTELDRKIFLYAYNELNVRDVEYRQATFNLSNTYLNTGNYFLASKLMDKLAEQCRATFSKSSEEYISAQSYLAIILLESGTIKESGQTFQSILESVENLPVSKEKAFILSNYARYLTESGSYSGAENYYRQSLFIISTLGSVNDIAEAEVLTGLSALYIKLNNLTEAFLSIQKAREALKNNAGPLNPLWQRIDFIENIIWFRFGDLTRTRNIIPEKETNPFYLIRMNNQLALVESNAGNTEGAIGYLNNAKKVLASSPGHFLLAEILDTEYQLEREKGNPELALEALKKASTFREQVLEFEHPDYLDNQARLSLMYWQMGDIEKARRFFNRSLYLNKVQYQRQFAFLSEAEKEQYYGYIRSYTNQFANFLMAQKEPSAGDINLLVNNQLLFKGLLFNSTRTMKEKAASDPRILEKYRRYATSREKLNVARKIIDSNPDMNKNFDLDSMERSVNYLEKELSLRITLGENEEDMARLQRRWEDIRNALEPDEVVIEIIRINPFNIQTRTTDLENSSYIILKIARDTRKSPEFIQILDGTSLDSRYLRYYRNAIQYKLTDTVSYNFYWKPLNDAFQLDNYKSVWLCPDGAYNLIAPNTLQTGKDKKYLSDIHEIHLIGNIGDILSEKRKNNPNSSVKSLVVGYPEFNFDPITGKDPLKDLVIGNNISEERSRGFFNMEKGIPLLPGTLNEVETIGRIMRESGDGIELLSGLEASETNVKKSTMNQISPPVIHIATHGFFLNKSDQENDENPILSRDPDPLSMSGILFTGARYHEGEEVLRRQAETLNSNTTFNDGILYAQEVMDMELFSTRLVVLSACETGLGVIKNGEGVYGLQRAFQTAGANSIMMSLWKVDDDATMLFMTEFYRSWLKGNGQMEAFLYAQQKVRSTPGYERPYYWGAFILIGE